MSSDQLDRAMMLYRDLAINPDKAQEYREWAASRLDDTATSASDKLKIRGQLKLLDRAEKLTDKQKAFVARVGDQFDEAYQVAAGAGIVKTHLDHYVRRLWEEPAGREDMFRSTSEG